jgi:hypothetical protein
VNSPIKNLIVAVPADHGGGSDTII